MTTYNYDDALNKTDILFTVSGTASSQALGTESKAHDQDIFRWFPRLPETSQK